MRGRGERACRSMRESRRRVARTDVTDQVVAFKFTRGWMWRKASGYNETRCAATWDSSQINTFLLLGRPPPILSSGHLLSPLCSISSRPHPPLSLFLLLPPSYPQIPTVAAPRPPTRPGRVTSPSALPSGPITPRSSRGWLTTGPNFRDSLAWRE